MVSFSQGIERNFDVIVGEVSDGSLSSEEAKGFGGILWIILVGVIVLVLVVAVILIVRKIRKDRNLKDIERFEGVK